jgi:co-chaperonin GroES (HSP10)
MNLKPLADKIVVKPVERVKSQLIHVVMDEKDNMGTVVAVGPGKLINGRREMPIKVGAFVRFGTMGSDEYLKYHEYFEDGERYLILSWQDICFEEVQNA